MEAGPLMDPKAVQSAAPEGPFMSCLYWTVKGTATVSGAAMTAAGSDGTGFTLSCASLTTNDPTGSTTLTIVQSAYKVLTGISLQVSSAIKCCDSTSLCSAPLAIVISPVPALQCNTIFGNPFTVTNGKGSVTINQSPVPNALYASCLSWPVTGSMTIAGQLNTISGTDGAGVAGGSCSQIDKAGTLTALQTYYKTVTNSAGSISLTPPTTFTCCDTASLCNTPLAVTFSGSSKPVSASLFIVTAAVLLGLAFISKNSPL